MLKNKSVLIVEDAAAVRHFISSVLRNQLNCRNVSTAATGDEAIRMLKSKEVKAHLILSDWEMPGTLAGDMLLKAIRADKDLATIPFIMVTSRSDKASIMAAAQAGVSEYMIKPFSAGSLIQKIRRVLEMEDRRAMARFPVSEERSVEVRYEGTHTYSGKLVNVSQTGFLARMPVMKNVTVCVYHMVEVTVKNGEDIRLKAEVIRIETDKEDPPSRDYMMMAFQVNEISDADATKYQGFISRFSVKSDKPAPKILVEPQMVPPMQVTPPSPVDDRKRRLDMDSQPQPITPPPPAQPQPDMSRRRRLDVDMS